MNEYISSNTYWRTGVVLVDQGGRNRTLVKADLEDGKVFVHVSGAQNTRRSFLAAIRADLDRIHRSIPGISVQQMVPIPGHPEVVTDYDHLLDLEDMGEAEFVPVGLRERVNVKQLLNGIEPEEERRENRRYGGRESHGSIYVSGDAHFGDSFEADQIGVAGRNSRNRKVSVTGVQYNIDLAASADELADLRQSMLADAAAPEDYTAIGEVGHAEEAARAGDESKVRSHVARAGTFLWDTATKVGADLAASYSKSALGL